MMVVREEEEQVDEGDPQICHCDAGARHKQDDRPASPKGRGRCILFLNIPGFDTTEKV